MVVDIRGDPRAPSTPIPLGSLLDLLGLDPRDWGGEVEGCSPLNSNTEEAAAWVKTD